MKKKITLLVLIPLFIGINQLKSQGFTPPAEGKAVVYFVRATSYGFGVSFEFFHKDKYIGMFKGKAYMRYECEPGQNLFWASSENKEFVPADLQAGGTYIVVVNVIMGMMKAHVGMTPISASNDKFDDVKKLILSEGPVVISEEQIVKKNEKLQKVIKKNLDLYENEWKNSKNYKSITSDMAIPTEAMK
jgi:hypothetical protein